VWDAIKPALEKDCRIITPDFPGSGTKPLNDEAPTMESLADDVYAILQEKNIGRCTMIGHSMGGYVTLAFAEKYPQCLNGLGLFHSTAYADSEEKINVRRKGIEFIEQHGAAAFLKTTTPNLFGNAFKTAQPKVVDDFIESMSYFSKAALVAYYNAMIARPDRTAVLKQLDKPVLWIIGEEDKAVPAADSLQQSIIPATGMIKLCSDAAHMGMIESTAECATAIRQFMNLVRILQN
jgi:pimeloyl-ACP methyl ester carboxylesterase